MSFKITGIGDNPGIETLDSEGKAISRRPADSFHVSLWLSWQAANRSLSAKAEEVATFIREKGAEFNAAVTRLDSAMWVGEVVLANLDALAYADPDARPGLIELWAEEDRNAGVQTPWENKEAIDTRHRELCRINSEFKQAEKGTDG